MNSVITVVMFMSSDISYNISNIKAGNYTSEKHTGKEQTATCTMYILVNCM